MRKTRIIATIGPACKTESQILELCKAGMNVARINMSHGDYSSHQEIIDNLAKVRKKFPAPIALMMDTKGPEIRIGKFEKGFIVLKDNQEFTLTTKDVAGNDKIVSLVYKNLINEIRIRDKIYANNGLILLRVVKLTETDIICKVKFGGMLSNNKGLNIPGITPKGDYLSETDKQDILFAIKNKTEYIAASFVSCSEDVKHLRDFLDSNGGEGIKIIAKIENLKGTKNANEILNLCSGLMVARGDLGVEIPLQRVPIVQKNLISSAISMGKIVIIATEMLESMISSVRPTRAEVSDVANAIFEKVTAVMLSGETAIGKHPSLVVKTMEKIVSEIEKAINYNAEFLNKKPNKRTIISSICHSACENTISTKAKLIVVFTESGNSAHMLSNQRIDIPILALTSNERVFNSLILGWNMIPYKSKALKSEKDMMEYAEKCAKMFDFIKNNDIIAVLSGIPNISGKTNTIKIITIKGD